MTVVAGMKVAAAEPFVLLDRMDAESRAGADVTAPAAIDPNAFSATLDLHAHYVPVGARFGGYAQVSTFYTHNNRSRGGLGNLGVGAIYVPDLSSTNAMVVVHAGATVPTAVGAGPTGVLREQDGFVAYPRGSYLRVGVSPMYRTDDVTLRLDVGADFNVYGNPTTYDRAFHLNAGAGIAASKDVFVALEITSVMARTYETQVRATGGLSLRFDMGSVMPYAAVLTPVDSESRRSVGVGLGLLIGAEAHL